MAEEKINNVQTMAEEKINAIRIEALIAEEKLKNVKSEAKKDSLIAEEKLKTLKSEAENESLKLLYNIFTQEEYKEAKKKILAQKNSNVNNE